MSHIIYDVIIITNISVHSDGKAKTAQKKLTLATVSYNESYSMSNNDSYSMSNNK